MFHKKSSAQQLQLTDCNTGSKYTLYVLDGPGSAKLEVIHPSDASNTWKPVTTLDPNPDGVIKAEFMFGFKYTRLNFVAAPSADYYVSMVEEDNI